MLYYITEGSVTASSGCLCRIFSRFLVWLTFEWNRIYHYDTSVETQDVPVRGRSLTCANRIFYSKQCDIKLYQLSKNCLAHSAVARRGGKKGPRSLGRTPIRG
jgi:hypothetical protein